ncbi:MAG: tRNA uridine-5-carboxymethylaminomethyl(34) synthesis GTPase MnmE [Deltaproteobacteria bacterium]|jgi:tRNA modification GTPase|nr:tRNA uridine-5-carboxymethylaminomethyl(34) synthesis GTPase MnmE [Deltaproteobacteria bacterium]
MSAKDGDLIAAISTATGPGAVAMVRLSGPGLLEALGKFFVSKASLKANPRRLILGKIVSPTSARLLDHALAVFFPGPNSFTGEDCAEIQGHGGTVLPRLVLEAALASGARLANPGEFTLRAFNNGRMSLDQAEAVAEIVASESEAEAAIAAKILDGALRERIEPLTQGLLSARAEMVAALDFEEDYEEEGQRLSRDLAPIEEGVKALLELRRQGRVFREGLRVVLAGPPNAGKSSLFNAFLGRNRALVSKIAGTTRDYLEAPVTWGTIRVDLVDTAGLREGGVDELEAMGRELAYEQIKDGDLVLWLCDLTETDPPQGPTLEGRDNSPQILTVYNKVDLLENTKLNPDAIVISATTGQGLARLKEEILARVGANTTKIPELVPNLRQELALQGTYDALVKARAAIEEGQEADFVDIYLAEALEAISEITGRVSTEDLLTEVFKNFCLGK